jgi:hypothetical protein
MSASSTKRFCVRFTVSCCYKVIVRAKSPRQAVAKARKLWETGDNEPFVCFGGDTDDWDAERE